MVLDSLTHWFYLCWQKNRKRRNRKKKKKPQRVRGVSSESSGDREKEPTRSRGSESSAADVEIEYVTEEPEIYEPNFIFFKRIFEAFKVQDADLFGGRLSREGAWSGKGGIRRHLQGRVQKLGRGPGLGFLHCLPPQLTDDVKKEKEKEPEKLDKLENSAAPKKKGFEEEHKDSDDDSSDDELVRPTPSCQDTRTPGRDRGEPWQRRIPLAAEGLG